MTGIMVCWTLDPGSRYAVLYIVGAGQIGFLVRNSIDQIYSEHKDIRE